jgi:hypothetical protein
MEIELSPLDTGPSKGPGEDQGEIGTVLGKRNRVRLGAPRTRDWLAERGPHLPADVRADVDRGWTFRHVLPSLTLLPDRGCVFLAVELSVELIADPAGSARPLAYEVMPHEVLYGPSVKATSTRKVELGGEGSVGLAKVLAKFVDENSVERDGTRHLRERYGYGKNFSEVGWRMAAGGRLPLEGDVDDLAFVARVPPGAELSGRFRVAAEIAVETAVDRWLTRMFGPQPDAHVTDVVYPLRP